MILSSFCQSLLDASRISPPNKVVHLHASQAQCPLVQLCPPLLPGPVSVSEALATTLPCTTQTNMLFCVRLMPDVRRLPIEASGESEYVETDGQVKLPEYQLSFSEWLAAELRVQRSEDALSDPDRQEYQQRACQQLTFPLLRTKVAVQET
ncbi:hypothetical protein J4Q44_G00094140 [Coregonus suidteri]|uniref:Fanconi anaemia group A protein arcN subdomain domain-containing protein n=1 Tax=Coregonus suidteri TaxID=861788 RepID=A0AAN8M6S2_9TELE